MTGIVRRGWAHMSRSRDVQRCGGKSRLAGRNRYRGGVLVSICVAAALIAGCGSSTKTGTAGSSGTYTIGVMTDLTGAGASTDDTTPLGIKAGIGVAQAAGYHIRYVVADTGTTPSGALAAAQKLVEQDHVFAVIMISLVGFAASSWLTARGVPVIGGALDGPEWITSKNMFSVMGYQNYTQVVSTYGTLLKKLGVTNVASVGYAGDPASSDVAKALAQSAEAAGVKAGYVNAEFPIGSTNTEPIALAMKSAGVDGLVPSIANNSTFDLIGDLKDLGVPLKAAILATGYGGDLLTAGPAAAKSAQGLYFQFQYEPVEMHTAATERLQAALKTYAGVTGDPTWVEYMGYLSINAFTMGLQAAGKNPSQASLINAMLGIDSYDADGLFGSHSIGFSMAQRGKASGADNCLWMTQYRGSSFHLLPGLDPICGSVITAK